MIFAERRRALAENDDGHMRAWGLNVNINRRRRNKGSESDGRVVFGAVEGACTDGTLRVR